MKNSIVSTFSITVGMVQRGSRIYKKVLKWDEFNGLIIAGRSGSGKSSTASLLLAQMVAQGAKMILCDHNGGLTETLADRMYFANKANYLPPATNVTQIRKYIDYIQALGTKRLQKETDDYTPIVFVIDEFTGFLSAVGSIKKTRKTKEDDFTVTETEATFLDKLLESVTAFRKVNIRFMFIGHIWTDIGTKGIRSLRDQCGVTIVHSLAPVDARLFTQDNDVQARIPKLPKGKAFYNAINSQSEDVLIAIPYLTTDAIERLQPKIDACHNLLTSLSLDNDDVPEQSVKTIRLETRERETWRAQQDCDLKHLLSTTPRKERACIIAELRKLGWTKKDFDAVGYKMSNNLFAAAGKLLEQEVV